MEDIELVIKMPEKLYRHIMSMQCYIPGSRGGKSVLSVLEGILKAVRTGTPLPKGHGRLGDLDKLAKEVNALKENWNRCGNEYEGGRYDSYDYTVDIIDNAPTIIEADKEKKDGND